MRKLTTTIMALLFSHSAAYSAVGVSSYPASEYAQTRVAAAHSGESVKVLEPTKGYKGLLAVYTIANKHGVDPWLMVQIARAESDGDCKARSGRNRGVLQVDTRTARIHGISSRQLMTCEGGATAGVLEMKRLLKKSKGNVRLALIGYKCGESCMFKKRQSRSTIMYLKEVLR